MSGSKNVQPSQLYLATIAAILTFSSSTLYAGPPEYTPGAGKANVRAFPSITLGEKQFGEAAISSLGDKLPAVAAYYGITPSKFTRILREDNTAWIDVKGRLLYIEPVPEAEVESTIAAPVTVPPFPLADTFKLNSRPGSDRVIYLDFTGHTVTSGTAWNASYGSNIVSPPYTLDADPAFSDLELEYIQEMWRQVSEDYAPFDVNVTTEDPGQDAISRSSAGDSVYGTRVVITTDNFASCGCGGFAYLTAFNDYPTPDNGFLGDYYKPAYVFNTSLVGAGEAITHEVGHNLSLIHDGDNAVSYYTGHGSGPTGWAPIMGVGYYQLLVQWSKGEYSNANNTEDDTAQIQAYGAPLMADDHGDTNGTATALGTSGSGVVTLTGDGLIEQASDIDVFSFVTGGGSTNINVDPAPYSPNLDILATLYDSTGTLVDSDNPPDSLPAALTLSLDPGEYFLHIDGVGKGNPLVEGYTDYGSLGHYTIDGTISDTGDLTAPVARVRAPDYAGSTGIVEVAFDGSGSTDEDGTIVSWDWDFGDGNGDSGDMVIHTYSAPGTYSVNLMVTDNHDLSDNDSVSIIIENQPPVARIASDNTDGTVPFTVNFTDEGSYDPDESGSIVSRTWDFGDGSSSSAENPSHTYTTAGVFEAVLTVTDNLGDSADSPAIAISAAPPSFVDQAATSQIPGVGGVSGQLADTYEIDGVEQSIRESKVRGKKKTEGKNSLQHTWVFNVQSGDGVTLSLTGRISDATGSDQVHFTYSVNGGKFQPLPVTLNDTSSSFVGVPLNGAEAGGEVHIQVNSVNHTRFRRAVYLDQLLIRSGN